ncbi:MAG TPA: sulfotransferase [Burkholderiaceae bacterium]
MSRSQSPRLSVDTALRQGDAHAKAGRSAEAIACYRGILQALPQQPAANHRLGLMLGGEEGLALLNVAASVDPANTRYAVAYAEALLANGRPTDALAAAQRAFRQGAGAAASQLIRRAREKLAGVAATEILPHEMARLVELFNAGDLRETERLALLAVERYPQSGQLWKLLGAVSKLLGKDALEAMQNSVRYLPDDALAHSNLGVVLNDLGRHAEAVANLQRAVTLAPDYADGHNNLGVALKSSGRFEEAVQHYRLALHYRPGFDKALNNIGNALRELQRPQEAEGPLREAVAINPEYADAHNNLGSVLRMQGKLQEAQACFERSLQLRPEFAEACTNLGSILREIGRPEQALAYLQRAVQLRPGYADGYCNLGGALSEYGQHENAFACLQRALALKPDSVAALTNCAIVLRDLSRVEDATAMCRRALQLDPASLASRACLAGLMADAGEFTEAERLFRSVTEKDPDAVEAWAGIARLRKMRRDDDETKDWLENVQRILATQPAPRNETFLRFALGKYFDDIGDYGAAFANYQRANALVCMQRPRYDREAQRRRLERQLSTQDAAWVARMSQRSISTTSKDAQSIAASARPVFIVGMPRSGTSLAEQILASHPDVFGAGELGFWEMAAARFEQAAINGEVQVPTADAVSLQNELLARFGEQYLQLLRTFSSEAKHVVDKMPGNFRHLGLIHAVFPHARIIHMQRHPIDTCLSIYFHQFGAGLDFANDLEDLAHYHRGYQLAMAHWHATLPPESLLDVPYEALVDEQEAWTRKLLNFVGLPWDARCLDFHQTRRNVSTASNWQVRQKINRASVERWRRYESAVGEQLGPLLGLLN